jgi:hypothetical protein
MQRRPFPPFLWLLAAFGSIAATPPPELETKPQAVAQCLASLDAWIIAQPKAVRVVPGVSFELRQCKGIVLEGTGQSGSELAERAAALIASASGVRLPVLRGQSSGRTLKIEMLATPQEFAQVTGLGKELYDQIGDQGYALVIEGQRVVLAARAVPGMRYAITTLAQIAADRAALPGLMICDWPSLKYRGAQQDISRGQVPTPATLKRLACPKDIIIGSYYCAGGPYRPAWEKDYPRLQEKRLDFFAQAWIYSHVWLTPWVKPAAEFSDLEVSRGVAHAALGSITADWGDAGHFHSVGEEWLPFLYHGAVRSRRWLWPGGFRGWPNLVRVKFPPTPEGAERYVDNQQLSFMVRFLWTGRGMRFHPFLHGGGEYLVEGFPILPHLSRLFRGQLKLRMLFHVGNERLCDLMELLKAGASLRSRRGAKLFQVRIISLTELCAGRNLGFPWP